MQISYNIELGLVLILSTVRSESKTFLRIKQYGIYKNTYNERKIISRNPCYYSKYKQQLHAYIQIRKES